jgi:hypothetical protein
MTDEERARRVFVLGAGVSKACGLPLANELLEKVFQKGSLRHKNRLVEFLHYLYPHFDPRWGNYPNIEEFLSLLESVLTFNEKVKSKHSFENKEIRKLRDDLLKAIAGLLYIDDSSTHVRSSPIFHLAEQFNSSDAVITFNWDLLLERALLELGINWRYAREREGQRKLILLKPHGSIDWFDREKADFKRGTTSPLLDDVGVIRIYPYFDPPHRRTRVLPVIIPPTFAKKWRYKEFDSLWRQTWHYLRYADEIYMLGFSLPPEDMHVRFVMRSAIRANERSRSKPLTFKLVNPDRGVFLRCTNLVDTHVEFYECGLERISFEDLTTTHRTS